MLAHRVYGGGILNNAHRGDVVEMMALDRAKAVWLPVEWARVKESVDIQVARLLAARGDSPNAGLNHPEFLGLRFRQIHHPFG